MRRNNSYYLSASSASQRETTPSTIKLVDTLKSSSAASLNTVSVAIMTVVLNDHVGGKKSLLNTHVRGTPSPSTPLAAAVTCDGYLLNHAAAADDQVQPNESPG